MQTPGLPLPGPAELVDCQVCRCTMVPA